MNNIPNVNLERIEEADLKHQSQLNKCLNEKRRRQSEIGYLDELAGYISADMCSLSVKPDKCAILQETVNQIRRIKLAEEGGSSDDLQQSEVSSSKPNVLGNEVLGPLLLQALDGFLFMVNTEGKIEFISGNIGSFLNYNQENLVDKSIYNFIHVGDHARFSSNLLPMSIGNGYPWSGSNFNKSRTFNCRFLIKPPEEQEETVEEKQTRVSQYENLQISAVLLPSNEKSENNELDAELPNHLICVARRMPANEKGAMPGIEQFSTSLDLRGKILSIDTTGVSSTYTQYLNKDLIGRIFQELCYPEDFTKLTQHLKETLQVGSNTSGVYRLRLAHEKILHVQTKSKHFGYSNIMANEQEVILATHSIISDHCLDNSAVVPQRSGGSHPSPASSSMAALGGMNGNSYSFSPQDFSLDIGLEMFPSSSWADLGAAQELADSAHNSVSPMDGSSTQPSVTQQQQQRVVQHFSPELRSPAQSPAQGAGGRATPYGGGMNFSPSQQQASALSRTNSPSPALVKREELGGDLSAMSPLMGGDGQSAVTQKLRNLLTHGMEEADSSVPKSEKMDEGSVENSFVPRSVENAVNCHGGNYILRELLNQEDEDLGEDGANGLQCDSNYSVQLAGDMCSSEALQKKTVNNNRMLRKLLNNDEDKSFRKNQDLLIQQLLKTEGKVAVDANNAQKAAKAGGPSNLPSPAVEVMNSVAKRKSPDTPMEDSAAKRPTQQNPQHAHLAEHNPMLASMLAQTPRSAPTVPTSVANAIVSQLPQDRLPKNLREKLVHTPYTGAMTSTHNVPATNSQAYGFGQTRNLLTTSSLQQEVVTADTRGHVTLAPQNFGPATFMGKMGDGMQQGYAGNHYGQGSQLSAASLIFGDAIVNDATNENNLINTSDPLLSEILDQVWSMEQDMNMDSNPADDLALYKLLEVDQIPDQAPVTSPRPPPQQEVNEKMAINAIQRQLMSFEVASATRNRFSQPSVPQVAQNQMVPRSYAAQQVNHYQQAPPAYAMSAVNPNQRTRAPPVMHQGGSMSATAQQMVQMNSQQQRQGLPQYGAGGLTSLNDLPPQMRRTLLEHKQKLLMQHQQKRLMMQQQKQQLTLNTRQALPDNIQNIQSPSQAAFAENMNDLMNSVAPNVSLQRSSSMPEPQLSPRYQQQLSNPPPSPSQLSPGQQRQPSFSPHSQQSGYPGGGYPQSRLSPHLQQQQPPPGGQSWVQRPAQNAPPNLTQQNPMLNAQLSQQASFSNHVTSRFSNQQQQPRQMVVRSMPSPGSRNSPYSNPPDSPFHPPSPGVTLYQQQSPTLPPPQQAPAPQQRLQRAVPIPNRVNSPRGLQAGFTGNDPLLSPQPSPGNYNPPPVSNYNSMPVSTSSNFNADSGFSSYDQQVYPAAMMDRNRTGGGGAMTSEYVRQELRAMVGARTQQHQVHHQQIVQQMPPTPGSQSSNQSALSHADFESLGFSLDLGNDVQPSSPSLFPQALLSVAGGSENQSRTGSPRFQLEEQRPVEQKKSLLQQLLSEPP